MHLFARIMVVVGEVALPTCQVVVDALETADKLGDPSANVPFTGVQNGERAIDRAAIIHQQQ